MKKIYILLNTLLLLLPLYTFAECPAIKVANNHQNREEFIRLRFVSAMLKKPKDWSDLSSFSDWKKRLFNNNRFEKPDPYIVVFLNGKILFLTPESAILKNTYNPEWNVIIPKYFRYSIKDKDEITILIKDKDTDVVALTSKAISSARIVVDDKASGFQINVNEDSFNGDDTIGRWSGKIPSQYLMSNDDSVWNISFGDVLNLKMIVEKKI
jgi:hypothetical protein